MGTGSERPEASATQSAVADPRFRRLLGAKLCVDIAEYALAYALLITIVRRTGSGIHSTLLVVAYTVPAIFFGIPAGAIADRLPKRPVLVAALVVRIALVVLLYRVIADVWQTYAIIFLFAAVGQVFGPVWVSVLPQLVGYERLSRAHALLNLAQLGGQVVGVVVLAPLLLKTIGDRAVFVAAALFLVGAAVMAVRVGPLARSELVQEPMEENVRDVRGRLLAGWEIINGDAKVFMAATQLAIVASLLKSLVVLFPFYTRQVLHLAPENTVYVAAPAAVGAVLGLVLASFLQRLGAHRVATTGFVILVIGIAALALVNLLRPVVTTLHLGMTGLAHAVDIPPVVTTAMLFAVPVGFGLSLNLVAARTVLNERVPEGIQARVFATQGAIANIGSLVPLFLTGVLTSLIGARPVMLLAAIVSAVLPIWLAQRRQRAATATPSRARTTLPLDTR